MGTVSRGISASAVTALSTSYTVVQLSDNTTPEAFAQEVPDECLLVDVAMHLNTIAGGATEVTWFLAVDSGADVPITREVAADPIVFGNTTATKGSTINILIKDHKRPTAGEKGAIYLAVKLDAGTANLVGLLTWRLDP
jgi:hypothetical protein